MATPRNPSKKAILAIAERLTDALPEGDVSFANNSDGSLDLFIAWKKEAASPELIGEALDSLPADLKIADGFMSAAFRMSRSYGGPSGIWFRGRRDISTYYMAIERHAEAMATLADIIENTTDNPEEISELELRFYWNPGGGSRKRLGEE